MDDRQNSGRPFKAVCREVKMFGTELQTIQCPYCAEPIEVIVDTSVDMQEYIEDCQVCCRPITMQVSVDAEEIVVRALDENEY